MKACVVISALCFISLVSSVPMHNGMVFYHMPYYDPYQAMLFHYSPRSPGRSSSTSEFAAGDAVAAGSVVRENRVVNDFSRATDQQSSANDGNVEAIAEAYPADSIDGTVQFDQNEPYNEVIPLNSVSPMSEPSRENIAPKQEIATDEPQVQTTMAPKKKVHISLDIPENSESHDETESDEDEPYPYAPQKPGKGGAAPMFTFFPMSFGRAAGGTIAVANAYSTSKGAVRSHAIAYGSNGATRRHSSERHIAATH